MSDFTDDIVGTLFLGGMFYLVDRCARSKALKEVKQDIESMELDRLRKELDMLKKAQA